MEETKKELEELKELEEIKKQLSIILGRLSLIESKINQNYIYIPYYIYPTYPISPTYPYYPITYTTVPCSNGTSNETSKLTYTCCGNGSNVL